jgi:hypothetical protein
MELRQVGCDARSARIHGSRARERLDPERDARAPRVGVDQVRAPEPRVRRGLRRQQVDAGAVALASLRKDCRPERICEGQRPGALEQCVALQTQERRIAVPARCERALELSGRVLRTACDTTPREHRARDRVLGIERERLLRQRLALITLLGSEPKC